MLSVASTDCALDVDRGLAATRMNRLRLPARNGRAKEWSGEEWPGEEWPGEEWVGKERAGEGIGPDENRISGDLAPKRFGRSAPRLKLGIGIENCSARIITIRSASLAEAA